MRVLYTFCIIIAACCHTRAQSSTGERVVARAIYQSDGADLILDDSSDFYWSAGRSSVQNGVDVQLSDYDSLVRSYPASGKTTKTYDANGNVVSWVRKSYDKASSSWTEVWRTDYLYFGKKLDQEVIRELREGVLSNARQISYKYSGDDLVEKFHQVWIEPVRAWEDGRRFTYTYSGGRLTEQVEDRHKTTYQYGSSGELIVKEQSDFRGGVWLPQLKDSNIYFGGLLTEKITFRNKSTTGTDWLRESRIVNDYSSGKLNSAVLQVWDQASEAWVNSSRKVNTYFGKYLKDSTLQTWDPVGAGWQDNFRYVYTYNVNDHLTSQTREEWMDGSWQPTPSDIEPTRIVYYYEPFLGIAGAQATEPQVALYPNPAKGDFTYLDYDATQNKSGEIVLRDVSGKEILRLSEQGSIGHHSVAIPVSNLSEGFYFVTLYLDEENSKTLHFVK